MDPNGDQEEGEFTFLKSENSMIKKLIGYCHGHQMSFDGKGLNCVTGVDFSFGCP